MFCQWQSELGLQVCTGTKVKEWERRNNVFEDKHS